MRALPNALTWLRIGLIPLFVVLFYLPLPWGRPAAAIVFGIAGLTDWLVDRNADAAKAAAEALQREPVTTAEALPQFSDESGLAQSH